MPEVDGTIPRVVSGKDVYVTRHKWHGGICHTLVVDCSDPRLPEARNEFLEEFLKVKRIDPIFIPGGPAVMTLSAPFYFAERERVKVLHDKHTFSRVIGMAHHDCLYYLKKFPGSDERERYERQIADLKTFQDDIHTMLAGVRVELFYALPDAEGFVHYQRILV